MKYLLSLSFIILFVYGQGQKPIASLAFDFNTQPADLGSDPSSFRSFDQSVFFTLNSDEKGSELAYYDGVGGEISIIDFLPGKASTGYRVVSTSADTAFLLGAYNDSLRSNLAYILAGTREINPITNDSLDINIPVYAIKHGKFWYWEVRNNAEDCKQLFRLNMTTGEKEFVLKTKNFRYSPEDAIQGVYDDWIYVRLNYDGPMVRIKNNQIDTIHLFDTSGQAAQIYRVLAYYEGSFLFRNGGGASFWNGTNDTVSSVLFRANSQIGGYIQEQDEYYIQKDSLVYFEDGGYAPGEHFFSSVNLVTGKAEKITPTSFYSGDHYIEQYGDHVYFYKKVDTYSMQLWRSDGTTQGTEPYFTFPGGWNYRMNAVGDYLIFTGNNQIWWMKDTSSKPEIFNTGVAITGITDQHFHGSSNSALISATSSNLGGGREPWIVDFDDKTVINVADYKFSTEGVYFWNLEEVDGKLVFITTKNRRYGGKDNYYQMYMANEDATDASLYHEFFENEFGYRDPIAREFISTEDSLFFWHQESNNITYLWGAKKGEAPVRLKEDNIVYQGIHAYRHNPVKFKLADKLFYEAYTGGQTSPSRILKVTTGSPMKSVPLVMTSSPNTYFELPQNIMVYKDWLYFQAYYDGQGVIARTKGTPESTQILADHGPSHTGLTEMDILGDELFFIKGIGYFESQLYKLDLNNLEVSRILPNGYTDSEIRYLEPYDGSMFFTATTNKGSELWRVEAGSTFAKPVADLVVGSGSARPAELVHYQNQLLFIANSSQYGQALFSLDSATALPRKIHILKREFDFDDFPSYRFGNRVAFFYRTDRSLGESALMVSDGTEEGTETIITSEEGYGLGGHDYPVVIKDRLYFAAGATVVGEEIFTIGSCAENMEKPVVAENQGFLETSSNYNEYQWYDCDLVKKIQGAEESSFQPEKSGWYKVEASNGNCSLSSECVYFEATGTSISDLENEQFSIFPNPTSDLVSIRSSQTISEYAVYDVQGKILLSHELAEAKKQMQIDIQHLAAGMYRIQIKTDRGEFTKAIVKQ